MLSCGAIVTVVVQVWFADILTVGMVSVAVCVIMYLLWLYVDEKLQRRKDKQERRRQRLAHWGYE